MIYGVRAKLIICLEITRKTLNRWELLIRLTARQARHESDTYGGVVCQQWSEAGVGEKGNTRQVTAKEYHPHCYTRDNCVIYFKESGAEELRWPHTSTGSSVKLGVETKKWVWVLLVSDRKHTGTRKARTDGSKILEVFFSPPWMLPYVTFIAMEKLSSWLPGSVYVVVLFSCLLLLLFFFFKKGDAADFH